MTFSVFLPGRVTNPLNGSHSHWRVRAAWAKGWREKCRWIVGHEIIMAAGTLAPRMPKRITFTCHVLRRFDDDNLAACVKPIRDGLKDAGIIHDDGPASGHRFLYAQVVDRKHLGVDVCVECDE